MKPVRNLRAAFATCVCVCVCVRVKTCACSHTFIRQAPFESSNLVDPASSHMLVSKIKPCMSKYK